MPSVAPASGQPLDEHALDQLFRTARTHNAWQDRPVSDTQLKQIYELMKFGPTSANISPARIVFVTSAAAKEKLRPALDAGNVVKTMAAPAVAIVAQDLGFYEKLPYLFPHTDARSWFAGKPLPELEVVALRNSSLQGAYLILAARALGLDCGPMSGFNNALVDETFFKGTRIKSNFLINIAYGDPDPKVLFPRSPRLSFDEACRIE